MHTIAMIQARMASTRLPGKVLMEIEGKNMLARVINRVSRAKTIDQTMVVTSTNPADEKIVLECQRLKIPFFKGSERDVLDRYHEAAVFFKAKNVVRITSDCPLIDPDTIDLVVSELIGKKVDYASNVLKRTFPRGLDVEAFTFETLHQTHLKAKSLPHREHVTLYIIEHLNEFKSSSIVSESDFSHYRWTVDTAEDLNFIKAIYSRLKKTDFFSWKEVLLLLQREPALSRLNAHIKQKANEEFQRESNARISG